MRRVIAEYPFVSDEFRDRLREVIDEEMMDVQCELGIRDGGLPPVMEMELDIAFNVLLAKIDECLTWQMEHWADEQGGAV